MHRWLRKGLRLCAKKGSRGWKNGSFCSVSQVIPRGQINPRCLSPLWERKNGNNKYGRWVAQGRKLAIVCCLVYNTGLSQGPHSPAPMVLWAKLKALDKLSRYLSHARLRKSPSFSGILIPLYILRARIACPVKTKRLCNRCIKDKLKNWNDNVSVAVATWIYIII